MITANILFWVGVVILSIIFLIWCLGIVRTNHDAYSDIDVACAGSVDNSYPESVKVKIPTDPMTDNKNVPDAIKYTLKRYIVKGNSMQYANIHTDDIVYVAPVSAIDFKLPAITLLSFTPKTPGNACHKIRRTWQIVDADISLEDFKSNVLNILCSEQFVELRREIGDRCPSDSELVDIALASLSRYRDAHPDLREHILISTTFRTERNRLEFSVHPVSAIAGIVAYVTRRR